MITPTPAPKPSYPNWLVVPYAQAFAVGLQAILILMGIGGFDFAGIAYETPGSPVLSITIAALFIFSLPFLLRLQLSPLARFLSATFTVAGPLFVLANAAYLMSQGVLSMSVLAVVGCALLVATGAMSFVVLNGPKALRVKLR